MVRSNAKAIADVRAALTGQDTQYPPTGGPRIKSWAGCHLVEGPFFSRSRKSSASTSPARTDMGSRFLVFPRRREPRVASLFAANSGLPLSREHCAHVRHRFVDMIERDRKSTRLNSSH